MVFLNIDIKAFEPWSLKKAVGLGPTVSASQIPFGGSNGDHGDHRVVAGFC